MIVKVKEPQPAEIAMLRPGQILFTYLHLAPDHEQTVGLHASRARCASPTRPSSCRTARCRCSLRCPRWPAAWPRRWAPSTCRSRWAAAAMLMGGVPGVLPANVVVLGAGVVGMNAAYIAVGMGAHVTRPRREPRPAALHRRPVGQPHPHGVLAAPQHRGGRLRRRPRHRRGPAAGRPRAVARDEGHAART